MLKSQRWISLTAFVLVSALGLGTAQGANIVASETANDIATLLGTEFDVTPFSVVASGLESADGTGRFIANQPGSGCPVGAGCRALVVLTEAGGGNSDWFQLQYNATGNIVSITANWRSDSDPGGLPALPTGLTPVFVAETGGLQDITAALASSAIQSGFASFPSNITIQVQSDVEAVPEPATLTLTGLGLLGVATRYRRRRYSSNS